MKFKSFLTVLTFGLLAISTANAQLAPPTGGPPTESNGGGSTDLCAGWTHSTGLNYGIYMASLNWSESSFRLVYNRAVNRGCFDYSVGLLEGFRFGRNPGTPIDAGGGGNHNDNDNTTFPGPGGNFCIDPETNLTKPCD